FETMSVFSGDFRELHGGHWLGHGSASCEIQYQNNNRFCRVCQLCRLSLSFKTMMFADDW
ncbi:hypothetical protein, partial [Caballeronia humi]|uniref:hypothetical protein n=1 Tax=Caballeronia humi TaxID=326474 RepID=UPI001F2D1B83